jgi:hypothetical protein
MCRSVGRELAYRASSVPCSFLSFTFSETDLRGNNLDCPVALFGDLARLDKRDTDWLCQKSRLTQPQHWRKDNISYNVNVKVRHSKLSLFGHQSSQGAHLSCCTLQGNIYMTKSRGYAQGHTVDIYCSDTG